MNTTWYLHSHVVWLKAWYSSIGGFLPCAWLLTVGNPLMDELSPNLGDGLKDQAAALG
jgi:hypothetical protein